MERAIERHWTCHVPCSLPAGSWHEHDGEPAYVLDGQFEYRREPLGQLDFFRQR